MFAIGVDIGGTSIKGAAISLDGKVGDVFSLPVEKGDTQEEVINKLIIEINKYIKDQGFDKKEILGIGCGIPGVSDTKAGVVTYSNNLQWYELPIVKMMEEGTGLQVRITNDANAAALGEAKFGAGRKFKNILTVAIGTGVGGGIIINGKLYEGNLGKGAEIGHMVVEVDGKLCTCGRLGCLESYASAPALIAASKEAMEKHPDSLLFEAVKKFGKLDARAAFEAERMGDEPAHEVVENYIKYLGEGLLNYFNIFRPEAVVMTGGVANEGEYLFKRLREYSRVRYHGFRGTPEVLIMPSELGYDAGKIGAASLFF